MPSPRKPGSHGPDHKPTEESRNKVRALTGYGLPQIDIARIMSTDPETLRRHYRAELDAGVATANAGAAQNLHRLASKSDNPVAAIYWTKARMGWTDNANQRELDAKLTAIQAKLDELSAAKAAAV